MAGFLPDVPGRRVPYHVDGTLIKGGPGPTTGPPGPWSNVSVTTARALNDGSFDTNWFPNGQILSFRFPYPLHIKGHNMVSNSDSWWPTVYSLDTTDGVDGSWISVSGSFTVTSNNSLYYRTRTSIVDIPNVLGWRVGTNSYVTPVLYDLALYAEWPSTGLTGWKATLDSVITGAELDFGDLLVGSTSTKAFRIKNFHTLTANQVLVSSTIGTGVTKAGLSFSLDGTNFSSSVTIPSIAPDAISPVITVRRNVLLGETPNVAGLAAIDFVAASWT